VWSILGGDGGRPFSMVSTGELLSSMLVLVGSLPQASIGNAARRSVGGTLSDELGRDEIFVITFPYPSGGKWQVSRDGGKGPVLAHNGTELFYVDATNEMRAVTYTAAGGTFRSLETQPLFSARRMLAGTNTTAYDISPDDQRFLMVSAQPGGRRVDLGAELDVGACRAHRRVGGWVTRRSPVTHSPVAHQLS
jgi:hypothetical protein